MKTGAVAFLDILGFKGIWQNRPEADVLKLITDVPGIVKSTYSQPPPEQKWPSSLPPEITVLSDTFVITIESAEPQCIFLLANLLYKIIQHFLSQELFIRGAIGWGNYMQEENTFLGPAIDDVAEWYEKADWIGVISTPRTNYKIDQFLPLSVEINGFSVPVFLKYDVPEKRGLTHSLNAFNWPGYLQASYKVMPDGNGPSMARKTILDKFAKQNEFDGAVLRKYENTLRFIDYAVGFIRPSIVID